MRGTLIKSIVLLVLLLPTLGVQAEVSIRWGNGTIGADLFDHLDWESAYKTDMKINQGDAIVEVGMSPLSMKETIDKLQSTYDKAKANAVFFPGDGMSWGLVYSKGVVTRFLLVDNATRGDIAVYKIDQKESEFNKSRPKGQKHLLTSVPQYPGSQPTYYTYDAGTKTALEISRSRASAHSVAEHLSAKLEGKGWKSSGAETSGMKIYMKGRNTVYLGVTTSDANESIITRVHKKSSVSGP